MSDTDKQDEVDADKAVKDLEAKVEKLEAEVEKWKGLSRKHEDRAKENADAATELKKLQDADKSDSQKAADKAADAEKRATEAEAKALRLEVAIDKAPEGMSLAQVRKLSKRLSGSSKDELEEDAEELFADFAPKSDADTDTDDDEKDDEKKDEDAATRRRPTERLRPGTVPAAKSEEADPEKLADAIPRGW